MACCHYFSPQEGGESAFSVDVSAITFGQGCLSEAGEEAKALGMRRVLLVTDKRLRASEHFERVELSLKKAGLDVVVFDESRVEPTDQSFIAASEAAAEVKPDGYISLGGGSVIDTAKAANLYATHPADFLAYVNAPIGEGKAVPGPLKPHIACPTTSGTGSECTGITIFDLLSMKAKTGIASRLLRPSRALVDPDVTRTLPSTVVAASAFDVLSHALESYTALPYTRRPAPAHSGLRPMSQGANPWSDMGCREALRLLGLYMARAVADADDAEARGQVMWAATLAGIAFGNSGVHIPHGMSYAVAGLVRDYRPSGYPQEEPIVPHGMAVILNAPSVFRFTAPAAPERHLEAAQWLGGDVRGSASDDAGEVLAQRIIDLMKETAMPNGLAGVGYGEGDLEPLTEGAYPQRRLLENAPLPVERSALSGLFRDAMAYW